MWKKNRNIYNFGPAESHYAIHTHHLAVKSIFSIKGHLKVFILTILCMQQTNTNIIPWGTLLFFLVLSAICDATSEALRLCVFLCHSPMVTWHAGLTWLVCSATERCPHTHPLHCRPPVNANACGFHFWWLFILPLIWADLQHTFYLLTAAPLLSVMKASATLINGPDYHIKCIVYGE